MHVEWQSVRYVSGHAIIKLSATNAGNSSPLSGPSAVSFFVCNCTSTFVMWNLKVCQYQGKHYDRTSPHCYSFRVVHLVLATTEKICCDKCQDGSYETSYCSKCPNCNTTVAHRRSSPGDPYPWNREPPIAVCSVCSIISCSSCRRQSRCSNCLNDYCAACSSMKICSECDRQFCTNCTRSKY